MLSHSDCSHALEIPLNLIYCGDEEKKSPSAINPVFRPIILEMRSDEDLSHFFLFPIPRGEPSIKKVREKERERESDSQIKR